MLRIYERNLLSGDLLISATFMAGLWVWISLWGGNYTVEFLLNGNRAALYSTLASIFGALIGFLITAASIIVGFAGQPKIAVMQRSSRYPEIFSIFIQTIWILGVATIVAIICLIANRDGNPAKGYFIALATVSMLVFLRMIWCVRVLGKLIHFFAQPNASP